MNANCYLAVLWLATLAVAAGAVALYYYLQVCKVIFIAVPAAGSMPGRPNCSPAPAFAFDGAPASPARRFSVVSNSPVF
jgi:NADH:ubiquinone oxidoreductase subunit 2 (subunit N)